MTTAQLIPLPFINFRHGHSNEIIVAMFILVSVMDSMTRVVRMIIYFHFTTVATDMGPGKQIQWTHRK